MRPSHLRRPDWASMVLGTFAETKVPRLPGRTPATQKRMMIGECDKTMSAIMNQPKHIKWNTLRAIPIHMIWRSGQNHKFHMIQSPHRIPVQVLDPIDPLCPLPQPTRHTGAPCWPNPSKMGRSDPTHRINSRLSDSKVWGLNPQHSFWYFAA